MFGLIKEYLDDYLKFWALLGAALLKPVEELSFRARRDGSFRNSVLFLGSAILTNVVLMSLIAGQSLSDLRRFVIFVIVAGAISVLGYLSFAISWKLFRYKGDIRTLMRLGFYFNGIYIMIWTVLGVIFYGAFKAIDPALFLTYSAALHDCTGGWWQKTLRLAEIAGSSPAIDILNTSVAAISVFGHFFYWIASLRTYFEIFPMGRWRGTAALILAIMISWALTPLGWSIMLALSGSVNGC